MTHLRGGSSSFWVDTIREIDTPSTSHWIPDPDSNVRPNWNLWHPRGVRLPLPPSRAIPGPPYHHRAPGSWGGAWEGDNPVLNPRPLKIIHQDANNSTWTGRSKASSAARGLVGLRGRRGGCNGGQEGLASEGGEGPRDHGEQGEGEAKGAWVCRSVQRLAARRRGAGPGGLRPPPQAAHSSQ